LARAQGHDQRAEITETPARIMTEPNSTKHVGVYVDSDGGMVTILPMHDSAQGRTIIGGEAEGIAWAIANVKIPDVRPIRADEIAVVALKMKDSKHLLEQ
jgi:hypothetical protein